MAEQDELECGFRMLLHMYVAGFCCSAKEFCRAINKLRTMDSETLAQRCRNWVCDMLLDPKAKLATPDWIARLLPIRYWKEKVSYWSRKPQGLGICAKGYIQTCTSKELRGYDNLKSLNNPYWVAQVGFGAEAFYPKQVTWNTRTAACCLKLS